MSKSTGLDPEEPSPPLRAAVSGWEQRTPVHLVPAERAITNKWPVIPLLISLHTSGTHGSSDSKIIREFGIQNDTVPANSMAYGISYPGTYVVDPSGKVVAKFFDEDYKERTPTLENLDRLGGAIGSTPATVEAKHLRLSSSAITAVVHPNQRVALFLDIDLTPTMHVYAPGVKGYIAINWKMAGTAARLYPVEYPAPENLRLEVIKETVPVYWGHVRLVEDVVIGTDAQSKPWLDPHGELTLEGSLRYQACDDNECYIPETVPLK